MFFICAKKLASPVDSGQFDIVICNYCIIFKGRDKNHMVSDVLFGFMLILDPK